MGRSVPIVRRPGDPGGWTPFILQVEVGADLGATDANWQSRCQRDYQISGIFISVDVFGGRGNHDFREKLTFFILWDRGDLERLRRDQMKIEFHHGEPNREPREQIAADDARNSVSSRCPLCPNNPALGASPELQAPC